MSRSLIVSLITFVSFLTFSTSKLKAELKLSKLFSDHMVLQQNAKICIWGKSDQTKVIINTSWNNKRYSTKVNENGEWRVTVITPSAGGPYRISLNDGKPVVLDDVLIGEVWLCSGQSNMEMPVKGFFGEPVAGSSDILLKANSPGVRILRVVAKVSDTQEKMLTEAWQEPNCGTVSDFSAVGFQFAQRLQKHLKVPVGIIQAAVSGTEIELWMTGGTLYNGMISPLAGFNLKGMLWYQGESNFNTYAKYDQQMAAMVSSWRERWKSDFGFYYVQIAAFGGYSKYTPLVREAQEKALRLIPGSVMIGTNDIGEPGKIHPSDKTTVSKRLLLAALSTAYGYTGLPYLSPAFGSMTVKDGVATLSFKHADMGLMSPQKEITGFEVAGKDRFFYPAKAVIKGNLILLNADSVKHVEAARYCFKEEELGYVYNIEGLPLLPFRTDQWEL